MAWTAVNPVTVGHAMKQAAHWAIAWANGTYIYDWVVARKIFTLENTAPIGWEIISGCTDGLLAVKGGANAYNVSGGTKLAGTWTQPNHVHAGGAHTHATAGHTLTTAQIPSHTHGFSASLVASGGGSYAGTGAASNHGTNNTTTGTSGTNDTAHDHGNTGSAGDGGNTGNGATAITWRPVANVGILIEKSA
jgi:hypothetical protein